MRMFYCLLLILFFVFVDFVFASKTMIVAAITNNAKAKDVENSGMITLAPSTSWGIGSALSL